MVLFAEKGSAYGVRVSHEGRTVPLNLHWSDRPRPGNDDFGAALALDGKDGQSAASNLGATLEPGESFGELAATVWFDWHAPSDGAFKFWEDTDSLRVLAFVGDRIGTLRLVSGYPASTAAFPARRGERYRIAVAAESAFTSGRGFELSWGETDRDAANDDFAGAEEVGREAASSHAARLLPDSTVQPDEPLESGIRTTWYRWTAPADDRVTWHLQRPEGPARPQLSMFRGTTMSDVQFVARTGMGAADSALVVDVEQGEEFRFALGFAAKDSQAFGWVSESADATLRWGSTPPNDSLANAAVLAAASGTVTVSNALATMERGERGGRLGLFSLWWTFAPTNSGWYRFAIDTDGFALAVFENADGRFGTLDLIGTATSNTNDREVLFEAQPGKRYAIRVGSTGDDAGEFTLRWEVASPPTWLRYVANTPAAIVNENGRVELRPGDLAFNGDGSRLFIASELGLQVFVRDAETGLLTFAELLDDDSLRQTALAWDSARGLLYAMTCGTLRTYAVDEASGGFALVDTYEDMPPTAPDKCVDALQVSSNGSRLLAVTGTVDGMRFVDGDLDRVRSGHGVDAYVLDSGQVRHDEFLNVGFLADIAVSPDGDTIYITTHRVVAAGEEIPAELVVFQRPSDSGGFEQVADYRYGLDGTNGIAVTRDGSHLVTVYKANRDMLLFDLTVDAARPQLVDSLGLAAWTPLDVEPWRLPNLDCADIEARFENGLDAVCRQTAFSARVEEGQLVGTDHVLVGFPDRFQNLVPTFEFVQRVAYSPDGRHAYLMHGDEFGEPDGLVVLERVGNRDASANDEDPLADRQAAGASAHYAATTVAPGGLGGYAELRP